MDAGDAESAETSEPLQDPLLEAPLEPMAGLLDPAATVADSVPLQAADCGPGPPFSADHFPSYSPAAEPAPRPPSPASLPPLPAFTSSDVPPVAEASSLSVPPSSAGTSGGSSVGVSSGGEPQPQVGAFPVGAAAEVAASTPLAAATDTQQGLGAGSLQVRLPELPISTPAGASGSGSRSPLPGPPAGAAPSSPEHPPRPRVALPAATAHTPPQPSPTAPSPSRAPLTPPAYHSRPNASPCVPQPAGTRSLATGSGISSSAGGSSGAFQAGGGSVWAFSSSASPAGVAHRRSAAAAAASPVPFAGAGLGASEAGGARLGCGSQQEEGRPAAGGLAEAAGGDSRQGPGSTGSRASPGMPFPWRAHTWAHFSQLWRSPGGGSSSGKEGRHAGVPPLGWHRQDGKLLVVTVPVPLWVTDPRTRLLPLVLALVLLSGLGGYWLGIHAVLSDRLPMSSRADLQGLAAGRGGKAGEQTGQRWSTGREAVERRAGRGAGEAAVLSGTGWVETATVRSGSSGAGAAVRSASREEPQEAALRSHAAVRGVARAQGGGAADEAAFLRRATQDGAAGVESPADPLAPLPAFFYVPEEFAVGVRHWRANVACAAAFARALQRTLVLSKWLCIHKEHSRTGDWEWHPLRLYFDVEHLRSRVPVATKEELDQRLGWKLDDAGAAAAHADAAATFPVSAPLARMQAEKREVLLLERGEGQPNYAACQAHPELTPDAQLLRPSAALRAVVTGVQAALRFDYDALLLPWRALGEEQWAAHQMRLLQRLPQVLAAGRPVFFAADGRLAAHFPAVQQAHGLKLLSDFSSLWAPGSAWESIALASLNGSESRVEFDAFMEAVVNQEVFRGARRRLVVSLAEGSEQQSLTLTGGDEPRALAV